MKGKFYTPRQSLTVKGAVKVADKKSDAVAYIYTKTNRAGQAVPCAQMFWGASAKPVWWYQFGNEAKRTERIAESFGQRQAVLKLKAEEQAKRKAFVNPYKIGDLFGRSWGYDQTNVNYYEVTKVKGKYVWVREIQQEYVESGWCVGRTTPLPGSFRANEAEKKCLAQDGRIKINHYAWAYFEKPTMVAGVKTYGTNHTSSYA